MYEAFVSARLASEAVLELLEGRAGSARRLRGAGGALGSLESASWGAKVALDRYPRATFRARPLGARVARDGAHAARGDPGAVAGARADASALKAIEALARRAGDPGRSYRLRRSRPKPRRPAAENGERWPCSALSSAAPCRPSGTSLAACPRSATSCSRSPARPRGRVLRVFGPDAGRRRGGRLLPRARHRHAADLDYRLIPNRVVLPALVVVLALMTAADPSAGVGPRRARGGLRPLRPRVHLPAGMGMGDVKLRAAHGRRARPRRRCGDHARVRARRRFPRSACSSGTAARARRWACPSARSSRSARSSCSSRGLGSAKAFVTRWRVTPAGGRKPIHRGVSANGPIDRAERGVISPVEAIMLAAMAAIVVAIAIPSYRDAATLAGLQRPRARHAGSRCGRGIPLRPRFVRRHEPCCAAPVRPVARRVELPAGRARPQGLLHPGELRRSHLARRKSGRPARPRQLSVAQGPERDGCYTRARGAA